MLRRYKKAYFNILKTQTLRGAGGRFLDTFCIFVSVGCCSSHHQELFNIRNLPFHREAVPNQRILYFGAKSLRKLH